MLFPFRFSIPKCHCEENHRFDAAIYRCISLRCIGNVFSTAVDRHSPA